MKASVIVPAHNAEDTLPRTSDSLAGQELGDDYEVIVVDDGSVDGTADVARAAPGPVKVLSRPAAGAAAARNQGVSQSRGSVLAFCDADVFRRPDGCEPASTRSGALTSFRGGSSPTATPGSVPSTAACGSPARRASGRRRICS